MKRSGNEQLACNFDSSSENSLLRYGPNLMRDTCRMNCEKIP